MNFESAKSNFMGGGSNCLSMNINPIIIMGGGRSKSIKPHTCYKLTHITNTLKKSI